jgi:CheY-like chemotaxis protein
MLEDVGHTVFSATSGRQALEILGRGVAIDLMMTDQAMPEMTGAMLAEAARNERPNLRVILASGHDELPRGTGVDIVKLAKPFSQNDLERAVAEALRSAPLGHNVVTFPRGG